MSQKSIRIAATGGPCSGKTTFLRCADGHFSIRGWRIYLFSEPATELIRKGLPIKKAIRTGDLELFYECELKIAELCWQNYLEFERRTREMPKKSLGIFDRFIPDNYPYFPEGPAGDEMYERMLKDLGVQREDIFEALDVVIKMTTAADGAPAFYTCENNDTRDEALEEAIRLDRRFELAYANHPGLVVIDNSTGFEEKMTRALAAIEGVLLQ